MTFDQVGFSVCCCALPQITATAPQVLDVLPLADTVTKLAARCAYCGTPALFSLRIAADARQVVLVSCLAQLAALDAHRRVYTPRSTDLSHMSAPAHRTLLFSHGRHLRPHPPQRPRSHAMPRLPPPGSWHVATVVTAQK